MNNSFAFAAMERLSPPSRAGLLVLLLLALAVNGQATPPSALSSLTITNYTGYVLDGDAASENSNIQAQAIFYIDATSSGTTWTNVLSFQLSNVTAHVVHPIYNAGNTVTNSTYTYNITNIVTIPSLGTTNLTNTAHIRPAAFMSQFSEFQITCTMVTNGVAVGASGLLMPTPPTNYFDFTNTTLSGDTAYDVLLDMTNAVWSQTYELATVPGQNNYQVAVSYEIWRWANFGASLPALTNVPVVFSFVLSNSAGNAVQLVSSNQTFLDPIESYVGAPLSPNQAPAHHASSQTLNIQPVGLLDFFDQTYYLTVTIATTNNPGSGQEVANTLGTSTTNLLYFNGNLYFDSGNVLTIMTSLGTPSPQFNTPSGGYIVTNLNGAGGYVSDKPDHSYAGSGLLGINLDMNGNAYVTAGSVTLSGPSPDLDSLAGVGFQRGPVTLTATTATVSDIIVTLPAGFGYRLNDTNSLLLQSTIQFNSLPVTAYLDPTTVSLNYTPGTTIYAAEDTKPVWLAASSIVWNLASGSFTLNTTGASCVRSTQFAYLNSVSNFLADPPNMGDKRSNDKYWLALTGVSSPVTVSNGLTANFGFGSGAFRSHFPYDTVVQWSGTGAMEVTNDLAMAGELQGATTVAVSYTQDCPDCSGGLSGTLATIAILASNSLFGFTPDGGLVTAGPLVFPAAETNLQWGFVASGSTFAQQALGFTNAAFHLPGVFLRGDQNLLPSEQGPTTILYTGFGASDLTLVERPLSSAYSEGLADYAGLNFRCSDYVHPAISTIAGTGPVDWNLTARSKYYVRYAGVSGIHEAAAHSFPSSLTLWGYPFAFSSYGLSYLDNQVHESITDGTIALPYPAGFTQDFADLQFSCSGAPTTGQVPSDEPTNVMQYWLADFQTESLGFVTTNGCNPTDSGYLVLGIQGWASQVPVPIYGQIGFFTNGDQIPPAFGQPFNVTSRLKLPNSVLIAGPPNTNDGSYNFTPAQDAYYDTYTKSPALTGQYDQTGPVPPGWLNLYGTLSVPFFNAVQVHWQTSCQIPTSSAASNSPIYLAGGWGLSFPYGGWYDQSGNDPFDTSLFDTLNVGWPYNSSIIIDNYRGNTNAPYHPRAQRNWLGLVDFDYPLSWSIPLHTFQSFQPLTNDFVILSMQHQLTYLDPTYADLTFGAQVGLLPSLSVANMALDALGVRQALIWCFDELATNTSAGELLGFGESQYNSLIGGISSLNQLLDTRLDPLMGEVFTNAVDPITANFFAALATDWSNPANQNPQFVATFVTPAAQNYFAGYAGAVPPANTLSNVLLNLANTQAPGNVDSLIGQIITDLNAASNAIQKIIGDKPKSQIDTNLNAGLLGSVGGYYPVLSDLGKFLVNNIDPTYLNAITDNNGTLSITSNPNPTSLAPHSWLLNTNPPGQFGQNFSGLDFDAVMMQISNNLAQVQLSVSLLVNELGPGGEIAGELDAQLGQDATEMKAVAAAVAVAVTNYFSQLNYNVDQPFASTSLAGLQQLVRQTALDQFCATAAASQMQASLRQRLYDLDATLREQMSTLFQQVNSAINNALSESADAVDKGLDTALFGQLGGLINVGGINGSAQITGDSLTDLRIDGTFQLKTSSSTNSSGNGDTNSASTNSSNLKFTGHLEIKELTSKGTPSACPADGTTNATEVTLGASESGLDWISKGLKISVSSTFAFTSDNGSFEPLNLAGQMTMDGQIKYADFSLHDLGVAFAVGKGQDYLSLKGGVMFSGFDFSGGLFFGQTCTFSPLTLINPTLTTTNLGLLGNPPFAGVYIYTQGWLPLSYLVTGVPPSCMFNVSAGVGAGLFYFWEPTTVGGMQIFLGVSGQLLCLVSVGADVDMFGVISGGQFSASGLGQFEYKIGPCPICLGGSMSKQFSYPPWHIQ